jgi:uncharacterized protein (TIGR02145 family)
MKKKNQIWAEKNLDISIFRNGDIIPQAITADEWEEAGVKCKPAWSYYDNDPLNDAKYGKLYNWYAVIDPRGLAPSGWHIPTDNEWTRYINSIGGKEVAGKKMKCSHGWNDRCHGDNSSGFSGMPGGFRAYNGKFLNLGDFGYWWSSTEYNSFSSWYRILYCSYDFIYRDFYFKGYGMSVRCLMD